MDQSTSNTATPHNLSVVGYQANGVTKGYAMVTPTFRNVSGEKMPISEFKCLNTADGNASIQVVETSGAWGTFASWYNEFDDGTTVWPAGWFIDNGITPAEIDLEPGQAVFLNVLEEGGASVQSAGEVPLEGVMIDLQSGYQMIGNISAVDLAIENLKLIGAGDGMASIQVVNADGSWGTFASWYNEFDDGTTVWPSGWFIDNGITPAEITLTPGQSVFLNSLEVGQKAKIPSAIK